jgi:pyruvate kinase
VNPGDSIHFRNQNLSIDDNLFTDDEKEKILLSRKMGFDKFYLSYVESNSDICEVRELIGKDCELVLKIESQKGLNFVATKFNKHLHPHTRLMAARGDLYVEVPMPHDILKAQKLVIEKDNQALVGSRMLLSLFNNNVPACSDICELGLLKNIGYRSFLLCDDLCKKGSALERAVETFEALSDLI